MSRIDKTEDNVQRLFREYQDQWSRYAEGLEKGEGQVKVGLIEHALLYNYGNLYIYP